MKEILTLCTKNIHFTSKRYLQADGIAMGSHLGPILADIFVIELENIITI